jgi:exonuclease III
MLCLFPSALLIFSTLCLNLKMAAEVQAEADHNLDFLPIEFPKITITTINCNSLNMASVNKQTRICKIYGITSLKTDIILLSDIRLCNKNGSCDMNFITNIFAVNPYCSYKLHHQSKSNQRGVGILVKKSLNFSCLGEERDLDTDNYLLLRARINDLTVIIGSVYGPNDNNPNFYARLKTSIQNLGNFPVVLGGDWNATYSCIPLASNMDILNMQALPNINNSRKIKEICEDLNMSDPYRALFPKKLEYSFAPWGNTRPNRSRLDFFIISNSIVPQVNKCWIKPHVQSRLFDHKAVVLDFCAVPAASSRPNISNKILSDPDIDTVVELSALECYATYLEVGNPIKEPALRMVGEVLGILREAGPDPSFLPYSHAALLDADARIQLMDRKDLIMRELRDLNLDTFPLTIDDDDFMEILINSVRNSVISYQSFISKNVALSKKNIEKKLKDLKTNVIANFNEISQLELDLRNINESEINAELEKNPNFETLNTERITPFFLKMVKGSTQEKSQTEIRDQNGRAFTNIEEQKRYIYEHFANSFKRNPMEPENLHHCIENFLGPAILNHPLVNSLKLTPVERDSLEGDLSLEELDFAIEGANKKSAAGLDGLNTRFNHRYWRFFRSPLHRYASTAFRKGTLTQSFRSSIIKLIPKKGDAHDIKKWRPISLLGCLYKVISRAVNNRLKSVINRYKSRAQKGFTNHRYIQEVLINVAEKISYCKKNNVNGALLSIDQTRAFDTISHKYMNEVFRFFGFGTIL